jgi:hypothetical protein
LSGVVDVVGYGTTKFMVVFVEFTGKSVVCCVVTTWIRILGHNRDNGKYGEISEQEFVIRRVGFRRGGFVAGIGELGQG